MLKSRCSANEPADVRCLARHGRRLAQRMADDDRHRGSGAERHQSAAMVLRRGQGALLARISDQAKSHLLRASLGAPAHPFRDMLGHRPQASCSRRRARNPRPPNRSAGRRRSPPRPGHGRRYGIAGRSLVQHRVADRLVSEFAHGTPPVNGLQQLHGSPSSPGRELSQARSLECLDHPAQRNCPR